MRGFAGLVFFMIACTSYGEPIKNIRLAAGDDKTAYESKDYKTDSLSLEYRHGQTANLYQAATKQQLGLPILTHPVDNQANEQKIRLGRKLFFDRRLSRNQTMSCAMCHIPEQGFTNNELMRPVGFQGRALKRNAPTILNVGFSKALFADARETSLEQQVWSPLLAANEMNNPSIGFVIDSIRNLEDYNNLFEKAFGKAPDMMNIGLALAQYQRSLVAGDSKFDRWFYGGEKNLLTAVEKQGHKLFVGKAGCVACHRIGKEHALFTDDLLHNTGIGYRDSMLKPIEKIKVQLAPGVTTEVDQAILKTVGQEKLNDVGRYEITLDPNDRWKYKTPSLRNVELTAPYMHTGEFFNLNL